MFLSLEARALGVLGLVLALLSFYGWKMHEARQEGRQACEAAHQASAIAEEKRRVLALAGVANEAARMESRSRADADAARAALGRLRGRARGDGIAYPRAAAASAPAGDAGDLPTDVLGRIGEAARQLAAIADERGDAGRTCELAYKALDPAPDPSEP